MLVLVVATIALIVIVIVVPLLNLSELVLSHQRQLNAVEAASLVAAADLSRIVVNDPYYGYVALSDYPPMGKATLAGDGEPLPVTGINTIVATARAETILALALGDSHMYALAKAEQHHSQAAARYLFDKLQLAIDPTSTYQARDLDVHIVDPYRHARQMYVKNLANLPWFANEPSVKDFRLSLGWLSNGSITCTSVPRPEKLADVAASAQINGNYKAFVNVPVGADNFFFAALAAQPALADKYFFRPADGKQLSSVVKVDADIIWRRKQGQPSPPMIDGMHAQACAVPFASAYHATPGVFVLGFPDGLPKINSMRDLLTDRDFSNKRMPAFTACGGDYPSDPHTFLTQKVGTPTDAPTASQLFAEGLYDWVRTGHDKMRIDSLLAAMDQPLAELSRVGAGSCEYPTFLFEFDKEGNVVVTNAKHDPFTSQCVNENQTYAMACDAVKAGTSWTLKFRDQVHALGTEYGGKHGGQAMPGNPVNWCDLEDFGGSVKAARQKGKGQALGISATGASDRCDGGSAAVSIADSRFTNLDGSNLAQPRKDWYAGGMAVSFEVSSPRDISASVP